MYKPVQEILLKDFKGFTRVWYFIPMGERSISSGRPNDSTSARDCGARSAHRSCDCSMSAEAWPVLSRPKHKDIHLGVIPSTVPDTKVWQNMFCTH